MLRAAAPIDWPTVTPGTIDAQLIVDARLADDDYARIKRQGEQAWSRVVRRHTRATGGAQ